jgi:polyisoprenoid-binding protein YceI
VAGHAFFRQLTTPLKEHSNDQAIRAGPRRRPSVVRRRGARELRARPDAHLPRLLGRDRAAKTGSTELTIDTASLTTGDSVKGTRPQSRDDHLRSADFFNVKEFPTMSFKSTKVNFSGDLPASVEGNLTLLGVTKPVTLSFDRFKCGQNPFSKKDRCGGNASGKFKRSDFGMKYALPAVGDEIALSVEFEGDKE